MDDATARAIAVEGYTYLYPLVLMEVTRRQATNVVHPMDVPGRGPADVFVNVPIFPPADFRDVVRPNFDTLYSVAWLDLHDEPRIVSVPDAEGNFYLLPMYDMWGEVFASPGTRTTGDGASSFAVCPPGWTGSLPEGVGRYDAPTRWAWIIGRTEASVATYDRVHAFQAGLRIVPLSAWGGEPAEVAGTIDPSIDAATPPLRQVFAMDAASFFRTASELLAEHGPHFQDYPILDRLARIGFRAGETFDLAAVDASSRAALEAAVPEAQRQITDRQTRLGVHVDGWGLVLSNMGNYGTDYLTRACVELIGLGANLPQDAIYPICYTDEAGQPLDGASRYVWRFSADALPPVDAFWSITLYDAEGFQVANPIDRFAIGDRDDLRFGDDGALEIQIQHEQPEQGPANWLPAPAGGFNLCARLYAPKPEVLDGTWTPPPVTKAG